ncbi:hypothetical protein [Crossiella sp. NPDC003009]
MRRWLVALLSALVASGIGVTVNVATDLGTNVWAWVALGVLTLLAAGVAVWAQRGEPEARGGTHNTITGTVHGSVVQADTVTGGITLGRPEDQQR